MDSTSIVTTLALLCISDKVCIFAHKSTPNLHTELRSFEDKQVVPGKSEPGENTDPVSSLVLQSYFFVDSESESSSYTDFDTSLHREEGDFSGEEVIGKDETTSDNVWRREAAYNKHAGGWNEEQEGLARMRRSPQEFDDDFDMSSSEERGNKGKGKGRGRLNGKGKGKGNKKKTSDEN